MKITISDKKLLRREDWKVLVRLRANYKCEKCGRSPKNRKHLHAHHKDTNKLNHRLSNGMLLCSSCHSLQLKGRHKSALKAWDTRRKNGTDKVIYRWVDRSEASKKSWETRRAKYGPSGGNTKKNCTKEELSAAAHKVWEARRKNAAKIHSESGT